MRAFVLLQLSDLHFGTHNRFAGLDMTAIAERCADALSDATKALRWRERIELVLVTGDIAEAARPNEYDSALVFFHALVERLGLPRSAVVFVPGNHDVSWTRCKEIEGQLQDRMFAETELRDRLDAVKLTRFDDMVARFYDPSLPRHDGSGPGPARPLAAGFVTALPRGAHIHDFDELAVSVAALNSCEVESHLSEDHRGHISELQAQAVLAHWRDRATLASRLRIISVHHNPVPTVPVAIRAWRDWLRSQIKRKKLSADLFEHFASDAVGFEGHQRLQAIAADAQVSLLFHGHHHASDAGHAWGWRGKHTSGDTRVISAGSWGLVANKLPIEQPVVMQLVRVDPVSREVRPVLLRYEPGARADGIVEPGTFVLDEVTRGHAPLTLSLPAGGRKRRNQSASPPRSLRASRTTAAATLIAAYRARKRDAFARWDLRAVGASSRLGNHRPVEVNLDDMYVPLLFAKNDDFTKRDRKASQQQALRWAFDTADLAEPGRGNPIDGEQLLKRKMPLVIVGGAGSGKTTWMKRTFRQLIQTTMTVPFFLELRSVAASWGKRTESERTIEALLADEMKACGVAGWEAGLAEILAARGGTHPVVLVDGWDELGDLGERVRMRISEFRAAHERVIIVVSSRPYGESRPAGSEGFETLEIQPFRDTEIRLLTQKFHRRVDGEDDAAAKKSTDDFMARLEAAPEAQALARTALLLTMMLLLSREGPLPDKPHRLYLACIRNLLNVRPALRESEGAQLRHDEWRPNDQEVRLRVVAEVAYQMQSQGYAEDRRDSIALSWMGRARSPVVHFLRKGVLQHARIIHSWENALQLLPATWTREQRAGFLLWLINSAGVLMDRSNGAVSFAHLSFQEFLAAYFMFATHEGDARTNAVLAHAGDIAWWETLRLWAGLTDDLSPDKLSPVLKALRQAPHPPTAQEIDKSTNRYARQFWLAGSILADGTAEATEFDAWREELYKMSPGYDGRSLCASAWAACRQHERRMLLTATIAASLSSSHWLHGRDLMSWSEDAEFDVTTPPDLAAMLDPVASEVALARSRSLAGSSWRWPGHVLVILLRLWPSIRVRVSLTLQILASLAPDRATLLRAAPFLISRALKVTPDREVDMEIGKQFMLALKGKLSSPSKLALAQDVVHDLLREIRQDAGQDFWRDKMIHRNWSLRLEVLDGLAGKLNRSDCRNHIQNVGRGFRWDFGARIAAAWGLDASTMALWADFAVLEIASALARASVRAAIAHGKIANSKYPEVALLTQACRVSLGHAPVSRHLRDAAARFRGDRIWPALARHVARVSTVEDRTVLENAAARPDQFEGLVSWGLRYYVRGDIVMRNGTVLTMDEICDELTIPRLPLLEDMLPEIELDLNDDTELLHPNRRTTSAAVPSKEPRQSHHDASRAIDGRRGRRRRDDG